MSPGNAASASNRTPAAVRHPLHTLHEALQLFWSVADDFAKRRLLVALALVASGAVLAALTPIALKLIIDSLAQGAAGGGGVALATPLVFVGQAEQRVRRHVGRRLFEHLGCVANREPDHLQWMHQALSFLESLLDLFREKPEGAGLGARHRSSHRGELTFDRVTFSYREERAVLQDVSFTVPAGKTLAVVGVSGSGKSSLIRLLFRLYEPDTGRILLDGTPIVDLSLSAVRQAIAVVPQDTVLFHDTIASNIGFGRAGASLVEIQEAARIANLHEFIARLPDGYETLVGERGLKLSGGERQRVAIARAALKKPRIFVFDEATSSLDTKTEREILRNLLEVSARSTTLVIAHRLSTIVHADEIVVLDRGRVLEQGTHEALRARNGAYESLWRAQLREVSQREELPIPAAQG